MKISKYKLLMKSKWLTDRMIRSGIINKRYARTIEIYGMVRDYMELEQCSKNKAAEVITDLYTRKMGKKISLSTVWKAIQEMEHEIEV